MGIRGLTSFIKKYAPEAITSHSFNYFKGSIIAIDTSILLYKFRYSNNNPNAHINGFLNKCLCYIKNGILPVFILDGKPPPEKDIVINKRTKQRMKIENRIEELKKNINSDNKIETIHRINKLNKQIITVTKEHHNESKELLNSLGFSVIHSPGEAESICAFLQRENIVNFTYSDDTDVLALGCKKVLRSNTKNNSFIVIDLEKVLEKLQMTLDEFIDLCILCGCDYCPTIPKLNSNDAYELIKRYKSIEKVLEENNTYDIPKHFNYERARNIFKDTISIKISEDFNKIPEIDEEKFTTFLSSKKYKKKYIKSYIKKFRDTKEFYLPKVKSNSSISSMESYFS